MSSRKTLKREFAVLLNVVFLTLTARMFVFPPDAVIITALAPYYASFAGVVGVFSTAVFGLDAYSKQIVKVS